jgi:hypothetical protein
MKYTVEVVREDGDDAPVECRSLSSAGTKALNLLNMNMNRNRDGFVCVRVLGEDGVEFARIVLQEEAK